MDSELAFFFCLSHGPDNPFLTFALLAGRINQEIISKVTNPVFLWSMIVRLLITVFFSFSSSLAPLKRGLLISVEFDPF